MAEKKTIIQIHVGRGAKWVFKGFSTSTIFPKKPGAEWDFTVASEIWGFVLKFLLRLSSHHFVPPVAALSSLRGLRGLRGFSDSGFKF